MLEVGKAQFSICQAERAKHFKLYFIQSIALQFPRSLPEAGCYCRRNPEIAIKDEMCDSLRRGKRCWGREGTTPARTQPLEGAHIASPPSTHRHEDNLLQRSHPKKPTSAGKRGSAWHPLEALWLPEQQLPQKGLSYSAVRDHSPFGAPASSAGAKPCGMPSCPPPPPAAGLAAASACFKAF